MEGLVVGVVLLLVSNVSVLNRVQHVEKVVKGLSRVQLHGDRVEQSFTQLGLLDGLELGVIGRESNSDQSNKN